jgi:hypothetical protein
MECPSEDYTDEFQRIREKARGLEQRIATASLRPHEALLVKNTRVEPALGYSMAAGILSEEQAHKAQGVVVQPLLQALGFNATTPMAVVFAPLELGGIGFRHLFAEQGAAKTRHMLQQIRLNSLVGQNLVIMMQWAQVKAGISKPILLDTEARLPQLSEHKYITALRKYLFISGMGLHLKAIKPPTIKQEHDEILMDRASSMTKAQMSDRIFERINRCRKFLRVETIVDVTTSDGKFICEHAFACNLEVRVRSKKLWPNQPHVGNAHTKSWQWFLKLWCKDGSRELRQPLGKWLVEPTYHGWAAYYIETTNTVLTKDRTEWREHRIQEKQRTEWILYDHHATKTESETTAIVGKIPVEGWIDDEGFIGICKPKGSPKDWEPSRNTTGNAKDWEEYKAVLWECMREILKGCTEVQRKDKPDLMDILQSETKVLNICSDGDHINNCGSYGWVMASAGSVIYQGKGHAQVYPMSSYRAEVYGKLARLLFLEHYCECFGIKINCAIQSYCDNKEVIQQTNFYSRMDKVWDCLRP